MQAEQRVRRSTDQRNGGRVVCAARQGRAPSAVGRRGSRAKMSGNPACPLCRQTTMSPRLSARATAWVVLSAPNLNRALSM